MSKCTAVLASDRITEIQVLTKTQGDQPQKQAPSAPQPQ